MTAQIAEQEGVMQEVAMQIVDVYHIGLQSIHLTQEFTGGMF